jgi:hypothetical protein
MNLGQARKSNADFEGAVAECRQVVRSHPDDPSVLANVGNELYDEKQFVATLTESLQQEPAEVLESFRIGQMGTVVLVQGLTWVDASTYPLRRMRTDLLKPLPDIRLERQTTDIRFDVTGVKSGLWLSLLPWTGMVGSSAIGTPTPISNSLTSRAGRGQIRFRRRKLLPTDSQPARQAPLISPSPGAVPPARSFSYPTSQSRPDERPCRCYVKIKC